MKHFARLLRPMPVLTLSALAVSAALVSTPTIAAGPAAGARGGAGMMSRPMRPAMPSHASSRPTPAHQGDARAHASTTVDRTDTGITRTTTVTNGQGETMTSTTAVTHDSSTGTHSVQTERTGFDGKTSSTSSTVQKSEDGVTRTRSITNPNGETASSTLSVTHDGDGKPVVDGSVTDFKGKTRTFPAEKPAANQEPDAPAPPRRR
jgi:hypothetical protein